jgi:glycosyltransferase involved in cell wall biosynthesis
LDWIVSEVFYPDEVSTAKILTDIALKKSQLKRVGVICGPAGYEQSYITRSEQFNNEIKIHRVSLPQLNKNKIFQRILRLLILTFKMTWMVFLKVKKGDNIFLTTNPAFLVIPIAILKKVKGYTVEILVHDIFPENLVPAGLIRKDGFKYKFLSKVYNSSYQNVDRVIVLGEDMRQLMSSKINPKINKIDIIPNWSDSDIAPIKNFDISGYLGFDIKDKIVFGFAGNLGRLQGILELIDLFIMAENNNKILVIIGDGALRSVIQDKIITEKLHNIYYLGPKSRHEQNLFLNACHIGVITLKSGMKGLGVPSKTYNLMAAGKPLFYIGDDGSEIDNYVKSYECGWSFNWNERKKILSELRHISSKTISDIQQKGERSKIASENYAKEKILNLF